MDIKPLNVPRIRTDTRNVRATPVQGFMFIATCVLAASFYLSLTGNVVIPRTSGERIPGVSNLAPYHCEQVYWAMSIKKDSIARFAEHQKQIAIRDGDQKRTSGASPKGPLDGLAHSLTRS